MNIEKVAEDNPEAILYMPIDITKGNYLLLNLSINIMFYYLLLLKLICYCIVYKAFSNESLIFNIISLMGRHTHICCLCLTKVQHGKNCIT